MEGSKKLYILFGGAGTIGMPVFEFYEASRLLGENRVFLRDEHQVYYHLGLQGISHDIAGTQRYLKELIKRYNPERTILVGCSAGGYAALLFAQLLGNCHAVVFSPRTLMNPFWGLRHYSKIRLKKVIRFYVKMFFRKKYSNLRKVRGASSHWTAEIHTARYNRLDRIMAQNMDGLPNVVIKTYDHRSHLLAKELRDRGKLGDILQNAGKG